MNIKPDNRGADLAAFFNAGRLGYPEVIPIEEAKLMAEARVDTRSNGWRIFAALLKRIAELENG
jgi:hypothetical protein